MKIKWDNTCNIWIHVWEIGRAQEMLIYYPQQAHTACLWGVSLPGWNFLVLKISSWFLPVLLIIILGAFWLLSITLILLSSLGSFPALWMLALEVPPSWSPVHMTCSLCSLHASLKSADVCVPHPPQPALLLPWGSVSFLRCGKGVDLRCLVQHFLNLLLREGKPVLWESHLWADNSTQSA